MWSDDKETVVKGARSVEPAGNELDHDNVSQLHSIMSVHVLCTYCCIFYCYCVGTHCLHCVIGSHMCNNKIVHGAFVG